MNKNEKNIQYKIIKSEACGHSIEYKMIKKEGRCWDGYEPTPGKEPYSKGSCKPIKKEEFELEKAKADEGLSATQKKKVRSERKEGYKPHEKEKFTADGYREYKISPSQEQVKQKLKSKERPKLPSKEDLEYPMAASEEMEKCIDNPECDCQKEKKKIKKSDNFYIQKIQELRKAGIPTSQPNPQDYPETKVNLFSDNKEANKKAFNDYNRDMKAYNASAPSASVGGAKLVDSRGMESAQEMATPLVPTAPKNLQTPDPRENPTADMGTAQNQKQMQDFFRQDAAQKADIKSASNQFIGNLASNKPKTAEPTSSIPMAAPAPGTPGLAPAPAANPAAANPAAANPAANPAAANPAAANPAAMRDPFKQPAPPTANQQAAANPTFAQEFNKFRNQRIGGDKGADTFEWNGKKYHSFSKDDFAQGLGAKYNPAAKTGAAAANPAAQAAANPAAQAAANPAAANPAAANPAAANKTGSAAASSDSNRPSNTPFWNKARQAIKESSNSQDEYNKKTGEQPSSKKIPILYDPTDSTPGGVQSGYSSSDKEKTNRIRSMGDMPVEMNHRMSSKDFDYTKKTPKDIARADRVFEQQNNAKQRLGEKPLTREEFDKQWDSLPRGEQIRY
jgi:hypothetical protein